MNTAANNQWQAGDQCLAEGDYKTAEAYYKKSIQNEPVNQQLLLNLGVAFHQTGMLSNARRAYIKSLELNPANPAALLNLGLAYQKEDKLEEAILAYRKALRYSPHDGSIHQQLGTAHYENKDLRKAIGSYRRAARVSSDTLEPYRHLAHALLLGQRYSLGWKLFLNNLDKEAHHYQEILSLKKPWSRRLEGLENQHITLISLAGHGDTLQFMRYLSILNSKEVSTTLCAQAGLHELIRCSGVDTNPISPEQAQLMELDTWAPLQAIPALLGVSAINPIARHPYIDCHRDLVKHWEKTLNCNNKPLIALCWQGNPDYEATTLRGRSIPLEHLRPVTQCFEGSLVSLQKGYGSEQLRDCSFRDRFVACQPIISQNNSFLDSAAILANCDLVISSDTALAHLAAGMGKRTWLLLQHVPDWRWGLNGSSSFWYPSMRLFRQRMRGDWPGVVDELCESLRRIDWQREPWDAQ